MPGKGLDWNANSEGTPSWGGNLFFLRWPIRAAMLTGDERYVRTVAECLGTYLAQMDDIRGRAGRFPCRARMRCGATRCGTRWRWA